MTHNHHLVNRKGQEMQDYVIPEQFIDKPRELQRRLSPEEKMTIILELAVGDKTGKQVAECHGISEQRVSQLKKEYQQTIAGMRHQYLEGITAEAIKNQEYRLVQYARDLEKLDTQWHPEAVKARSQILKNVADELGQAVPKTQINIIPAQHHYISVNVDEDV
jgi:transposase-like protein